MQIFKKVFYEEQQGFNGNYHIISLSTSNEEFKKFLTNHTNDNGIIFDTLQQKIESIVIIQKINIEKKHQNNKHGSGILKEILNTGTQAAIVSCDILQNQRFGFSLEQFYENHNFKAVEYYQDFPLMIYPQTLALHVIEALKNNNLKS